MIVERLANISHLAEIEIAAMSVNLAVAGFAGWGDAVESISAHFGTNENVIRMRKTEKVARFICGELFIAPAEDFAEVLFEESTAESKAIKSFTVDLDLAKGFGGSAA